MLSTLLETPAARRNRNPEFRSEIAALRDSSAWAVRLECSIAAETRRIFQALTLPEHIETWLSLPCCGSNCRNQGSLLTNGFSVAHLCFDKHPSAKVVGVYSSCRTRKLTFSWTLEGDLALDRTFVDIRLCGDFERSRLRLQHTGFRSEGHCRWHQALWARSLRRLCEIFEPQLGPPPRLSTNFEIC